MIPLRLVSPLWGNIAATVLLAVSCLAARHRPAAGRLGRLDEDWMPDWQKRDLGLRDGRSPRGVANRRSW